MLVAQILTVSSYLASGAPRRRNAICLFQGGVILAVVEEHQIPVRYIGLGEKVEDLREFDVDDFVDALFARPDDKTLVAQRCAFLFFGDIVAPLPGADSILIS